MPRSCTYAGGKTTESLRISFMGYLKGKSRLMISEKYPELKYKYRNREFWCRGYYVDTAGKNQKRYRSISKSSWRKIRRENN